jgi:hypothetical protein
MGVAIDGVTRISVTLRDGRTAAETPVANFYFVDLPADARPWDVKTVTATLADGTTYSHDWSSVSAPAAP